MGLGYTNLLVAQQAGGTSFGSFTVAKTVINPEALRSLRPGFWSIGKSLRIVVRGGIGTLITTPGTITFQVMQNAVAVFSTGAMQMNAAAHVNLPFALDIELTCRAIGDGTNANLIGQGRIQGVMLTATAGQVDGVNTHSTLLVPGTAPAVGTGFNSTVDNILDFYAAFSVSDAANTIKIEQYKVFEDN